MLVTGLLMPLDKLIATLDRLLHHPTTQSIKGESYQLKEKRKAGALQKAQRQSVMIKWLKADNIND